MRGQRPLRHETLPQHGDRLLRLVRELLDEALLADERPHRALDTDRCQQAGLQRIAHRVAAVEALPHREIAAGVEVARLDLVAGEMRHHRHRQRFLRLLGVKAEHSRDSAGRADRGQVGVVPAARRGREGVEHRRHHLVADRERRQKLCAVHIRPFGGGDHARHHVARMAGVALADEEVVVVVAAQQHAVGQRRKLGRRALALPQITQPSAVGTDRHDAAPPARPDARARPWRPRSS